MKRNIQIEALAQIPLEKQKIDGIDLQGIPEEIYSQAVTEAVNVIAIIDNITAVRKVTRSTLGSKIRNRLSLAARALYIAARKSHLPGSKHVGRLLLKKLTRQAWLPFLLLNFASNIAR